MYEKYRVGASDTFDSIADRFSTSSFIIKDINNMYFNEPLREGMDIIVPKSKETYFKTYSIEKGDTLYGIARKYNTNPTLLAALNGLDMDDYIYPGDQILIPVANYSYYITKEGDTLDYVSNMFKKNKEYILRENDTIYLMPGQVLVSKKK